MRKFLVLLCVVSLSCVMAGCSGNKVTDVSSVPKATDTKVESVSFTDFGEGTWTLYDSMGKYAEADGVGGLRILEDGSIHLTAGARDLEVGGGVSALFCSGFNIKTPFITGDGRHYLEFLDFTVVITTSSGEFYGSFTTEDKPEVTVLDEALNVVKIQIGDDDVMVLYNCGYAIYSEEK